MKQMTFCYLSLGLMLAILAGEIAAGFLLKSYLMLILVGTISPLLEMVIGFFAVLVCVKSMRINNTMCKIAQTAAQALDERLADRIAKQMVRLEFLSSAYDVVDVDCKYTEGVEKNKVQLSWKLKRNDGHLIYSGKSEEEF